MIRKAIMENGLKLKKGRKAVEMQAAALDVAS